jgi:plastocyanin
MAPRTTRIIISVLLLLGVTACTDNDDPAASTSTTSDPSTTTDADDIGAVVIQVRDNSFSPDATEVGVSETVTWDFSTADRPHDVVFDAERGSAILDGGTWSTSFDEPGTYAYECTLHSGMTGQLTVTD